MDRRDRQDARPAQSCQDSSDARCSSAFSRSGRSSQAWWVTRFDRARSASKTAVSRAAWGPLLEAGVQMHEYQPTMFHCKVLVVDDFLVSVGSTNFDNRSFRLNDEANLNIYDEAFAKAQVATFEDDLRQSRAVTLAQWQARPLREKAMEQLASLLSAQL